MRAALAVALGLAAGCRQDRAHPGDAGTAPPVESAAIAASIGVVSASPAASAPLAAPRCACDAPSLGLAGELDAHAATDLERCVHLPRGTSACGEGDERSVDVARFLASVPPLDDLTAERIVRVARRGRALGLNPRAFGLVGDSITASGSFLRAFGTHDGADIAVDRAVAPLLTRADGSSIIDYYRGHEVERFSGRPLDSFDAERAAKVGARAPFATMAGDACPADVLVAHVKPAIAVVTFGANDASYRVAPPEELADEFEKNLLGVVARLEARGVVVVLSNEMRHGDQPGVRACPADDERANDWRVAVATNAIVRRTAEIACREHLPFVDLRYALDGATAHGLGPDGVHPSAARHDAGHLDAKTLDCGYSIRGLVTLMALRNVVDALTDRGVF